MFESHPDFEQIDDNEQLWRYLDLSRYLDLLLRKQLFFNRLDKFEDPFEGKYNKHSKEAFLNEGSEEYREIIEDCELAERKFSEALEKVSNKRITMTVNAWHHNKDENYAMWNIYAKGNNGLAIKTSYKRLKDSFHCTAKPIYIGKVIYYDEHSESIPLKGSFLPFLWKRRIYEYEKEVRCCSLVSEADEKDFTWDEQGIYNGLLIPVDLDTLIDSIYISPYSPKWFRELITTLNDHFGIRAEIIHSGVFNSENFY